MKNRNEGESDEFSAVQAALCVCVIVVAALFGTLLGVALVGLLNG